MNNRLLSYKAEMFHQQNVPVKWELEWLKFLCCLKQGGNFEAVPLQSGLASVQASSLAACVKTETLYILAGSGILYIDPVANLIKPTNKTDGAFTWAGETRNRMWFSGQDLGLWYAELSDPYTVMQSAVTAGTFSGLLNRAAGWSNDTIEVIIGTGGAYTVSQANALTATAQLNHGWKYGIGQLMSGSDEQGYSGLWSANPSTPSVRVSAGTFKERVVCSDSSMLIFREEGDIYRATNLPFDPSISKLSSGDGIIAKYGMLARDNKTYLCTDAGIKVYNPSGVVIQNTNISTGKFNCCGIANDGIMYFCGEDGVFYLNNSTGEILPLSETHEYIRCLLSGNRLYFTDGQNVKAFKADSNTGASVAEELNLSRTKFGKRNVVETYSMLDDVPPYITSKDLRKLSQEQIQQRAASVVDVVVSGRAGASQQKNSAYNPDSADMCPIGEYGALSKVILGSLVLSGFNASTDRVNKYSFGQTGYFGYGNGSGFVSLAIIYIDDVQFFQTEKVELVVNTNNVNKGTLVCGLVEYPPEEWNTTYGNTESYYAIAQKMSENTHRKTFGTFSDNNDHAIDLSGIYNGPNAKTLVSFGTGNSVFKAKYINGENWQFSMYKVCILNWSDRISHTSTGNSIAKTLTLTVAILNRVRVFSIFDAFGSYGIITDDAAYAAMSTEAIEQRATALMSYAAAQEGQTRYKENNNVIDV